MPPGFWTIVILLLMPIGVWAQGDVVSGEPSGRVLWEEYFSAMIGLEELEDEASDPTSIGEGLAEAYEYLQELAEHPQNINAAQYEDFARIPGLNIDQISDIIYYRDKYGDILTLDELALIPSIDRRTRLFLSSFFYAASLSATSTADLELNWFRRPQLDSLLKHGYGSILATTSIPLYTRAAYENGKYLGDKYKYSLKVRGDFSDYIKFGITGSKDDGEPFFGPYNRKGFDNYSLFLNINKVGPVRKLIVGHYRIKFGQGLILNNSFSLGKQFMVASSGASTSSGSAVPVSSPMNVTLSGHSSRSDSHYLQGVASTIALARNVNITGFWSWRKVDATLNKDGTVSMVLTSGYHRTENDMAKRNNTTETMGGASLGAQFGRWHGALSGVYTWYDRPLKPSETQEYRRYYPRGYEFWNVSLSYGYNSRRFSFSGETATGTPSATNNSATIATVNTFNALLGRGASLTTVLRHYAYDYTAILAKAFADGGRVQNETGAYLGIQLPLSHRLRMSIYTDYAHFPRPKYQAAVASNSWDNNLSLTCDLRCWTLGGRYRFRMTQRNNSDKTALLPRYEQSARMSAMRSYGAHSRWTTKLQADYRAMSFDEKRSHGFMLSQQTSLSLTPKNPDNTRKTSAVFSLSASYFNTSDYDSRVYLGERGMLEGISFPSVYGHGMRIAAHIKADLPHRLTLVAKYGFTNYFDRQSISSAERMIPYSYQNDIDLQIKWKF